jgi:hypothetical protein
MSKVAPDAAPDNSTFAQRAAARGATKQISAGDALNKGIATGEDDDEVTTAGPRPATKPRTK